MRFFKFLEVVEKHVSKLWSTVIWLFLNMSFVGVLHKEVVKRRRMRGKSESKNYDGWGAFEKDHTCPLEQSKWEWEKIRHCTTNVTSLVKYVFLITLVFLFASYWYGKMFHIRYGYVLLPIAIALFSFILCGFLCIFAFGVQEEMMPIIDDPNETYSSVVNSFRQATRYNGECLMFLVDVKRSILRYFFIGFVSLVACI